MSGPRSWLLALAQGGAAAPESPPLIYWLGMFGSILGIWWFLLIRPQRQQESRHKQMLESLKAGDKVITTGGIHGVIVQTGEKTIKLKVADNVRIEVSRSAVAGIQAEETVGEKT